MKLLTDVIEQHPGTPWAARAAVERNAGFSVELRPYWYNREQESKPEISTPKL
jgi:hypothetical protein